MLFTPPDATESARAGLAPPEPPSGDVGVAPGTPKHHRHVPWGKVAAVTAVLALLIGLTVFGLNQRSSAESWRSKAGVLTTQLDTAKTAQAASAAALVTAQTDLSTAQGSQTATSAERDQLRNQLGLVQSDLTRVTSIRDQMKTSLAGAPTLVNHLISCYQDEITVATAMDDFIAGTISRAELDAAYEAHSAGHAVGVCGDSVDPAETWLSGLSAFGISPS